MQQTWTILKLLEWSAQYFHQKGLDSPRLDAELLLAQSLGLSRVQLYMQFDRPLSDAELQAYKGLLKRRGEREPLAYILGKKEFYSMEFEVMPTVLIPRPETELLVEKAIQILQPSSAQPLRLLDIGTGSGCIALSLAKHLPQARVSAIDVSEAALEVARKNAELHGLADRVEFFHIDFREAASRAALSGPFDLIASNPPYIARDEIAKLAPELAFEPMQALDGGPDGLDFYRDWLPWAFEHLSQGGSALLEIGFDQAESVEKLATNAGFQKVNILRDYSGHPRVALLLKY